MAYVSYREELLKFNSSDLLTIREIYQIYQTEVDLCFHQTKILTVTNL